MRPPPPCVRAPSAQQSTTEQGASSPARQAVQPSSEPPSKSDDDDPEKKFTVGGYVETYYQYNFDHPGNGISNYRGYDDRANTFTLQNAVVDVGFRARAFPEGTGGFDASSRDGASSSDGATADAAPTPTDAVTVILTKSGAPAADILAVLHDDAGAVSGETPVTRERHREGDDDRARRGLRRGRARAWSAALGPSRPMSTRVDARRPEKCRARAPAYLGIHPASRRAMPSIRRLVAPSLLALLACSAVACSSESSSSGAEGASDEDNLTSLTARSRKLEFVGTVYVDANASPDAILSAVRTQAQTAFGPLRTSEIAVNSRELKDIDSSTFVKRTVKVIDTAKADDPGRDMLEVKYTYKDDAVVAVKYARRSAAPIALMNGSYRSQLDRVLRECTRNDDESREFLSSAWYVFEPSLPQCQTAIQAEQKTIDQDRGKLKAPQSQIAKSEVDRLYVPIQAKLGADKTNRGQSYPEYARLYRGGVKPDKLVVSLVYGFIDHKPPSEAAGDFNWGELMTNLQEVMDAQGDFTIVKTPDGPDLSSFKLASGATVTPSFKDLVGLHQGSTLSNLSSTDRQDLENQFAAKVTKKWLTVEHPIKVQIGTEAPRDFAIQLLVYYGAESDYTPHKFATKNSDVFLYNGHSYIGFGPLDPRNFTPTDFAQSYQLFWIDGCVSYNYYEKDYIPLKQNGTKDLDLITNGVEAPSWRSGHAMGQFLVTLLNGKGASYKDLLDAAKDTDPLRVVDGELDNEFRPDRTPVVVTPR